MTKDEAIATAIATLENIKQFGIDKWMFDKEEIEAFDMAIEALQAKTDGDLISRQDAIEAVAQQWLFEASAESPYVNDDDIGDYRKLASELLSDIPSADRPSGEWIKTVDDGVWSHADAYAECDQCHVVKFNGWTMNYCPNCGAYMGGDEE